MHFLWHLCDSQGMAQSTALGSARQQHQVWVPGALGKPVQPHHAMPTQELLAVLQSGTDPAAAKQDHLQPGWEAQGQYVQPQPG